MASSSTTWRPKQQGQIPAASQGEVLAASKIEFPERSETSESYLLMATYNIGAPEDHSHTSIPKKQLFTDKLEREMQFLCNRFHAIFLQEISLNWSMIVGTLLPKGWGLLWGEGCCATVFKDSDWAADPAASQEDMKMFPDRADRDNACRHWRSFLQAGRI